MLKLHSCEGKPSVKGLTVSVYKVMKPLSKLKSQDIYWELINNKSYVPTSLRIWIDLFPFLETANWAEFFKLANKVTCEPFLEMFQYKILNRTLNCRHNLCNWKRVESATVTCKYCQDQAIDALEHHLVFCPISADFWKTVKGWCNTNVTITMYS